MAFIIIEGTQNAEGVSSGFAGQFGGYPGIPEGGLYANTET